MFFGPGGTPVFGVNTPLPHSAPNAATSPFYKNPFVVNPNAYPGAPGIIGSKHLQLRPQFGTDYKGGGDYFFYNFAAVTPALATGGSPELSTVRSPVISATNTWCCLPTLNTPAHFSMRRCSCSV